MISIVLAAGYATRLYPLTENFPKPLLKVGDKSILNWLLDDIDELPQITEHVIISNHKFVEHFNKWAKEQNYKNKITVIDDGSMDNEHRLGAVKDIQFALDTLNIDDDAFILAGDNVLDFSLKGFMDFAIEKGTSAVMCHKENDLKKQQKTAIIVKDNNGLITSFEEKPAVPKGNFAVPPFYVYRKEDLALIGQAIEADCNIDAPGSFAGWLSNNKQVHAYEMPGNRYDIGDVKSYEYVQEVFGG